MSEPALAGGTVLDRYVVLEVLGRGGMAVVYRVQHRQLGTHHALKVLTVHGAGVRQRLLQEGRVQAALQHPNIVSVTDVIDVDGSPGIVMELVRGPSLEQLLAEQRLTLEQCDHLAVGLLRGVEAAHQAGLVHRDLKPGNVLIAVTSDGLLPKVADFGLAKMLDAGPTSAIQTRSGVTMGTPAYMAPEQIRNARGVDARADIFALGAILYEMVSGRRTFDGEDVFDIFTKIANGDIVPLRSIRADVPERMERAITGALVVDKEKRVARAATLLAMWQGVSTADSSGGFDLRRMRDRFSGEQAGAATSDAGKAENPSSATFDNSGPTPEPAPERAPLAPAPDSIGLLSSIDPDVAPVLAPTSYLRPERLPLQGVAVDERDRVPANVMDSSRTATSEQATLMDPPRLQTVETRQGSSSQARLAAMGGLFALLLIVGAVCVMVVVTVVVVVAGQAEPASGTPGAAAALVPPTAPAPARVDGVPALPPAAEDAPPVVEASPAVRERDANATTSRVPAELTSAPTLAPAAATATPALVYPVGAVSAAASSQVRVDRKGDAPDVWLVGVDRAEHLLPASVAPGAYTIRARFADLAPEDAGTVDVAAGEPISVNCSRLVRRCR